MLAGIPATDRCPITPWEVESIKRARGSASGGRNEVCSSGSDIWLDAQQNRDCSSRFKTCDCQPDGGGSLSFSVSVISFLLQRNSL